MTKYIYLAFAVAILAASYFAYDYGVTSTIVEYEKQAKEYQKQLRLAADELDKAQQERTIVTKTKVKKIYVEVDPTGCADTTAIDGVLHPLRPDTDRP